MSSKKLKQVYVTAKYIQNAYDIKDFGDRKLPSRMEIIPADEPQKKTILIFNESIFNKPIDDSFFTQQNMKRVR